MLSSHHIPVGLDMSRHDAPRGLKAHLSLEETPPGQLKFLLAVLAHRWRRAVICGGIPRDTLDALDTSHRSREGCGWGASGAVFPFMGDLQAELILLSGNSDLSHVGPATTSQVSTQPQGSGLAPAVRPRHAAGTGGLHEQECIQATADIPAVRAHP